MRRLSLFFFISVLAIFSASAQSGCPGCLVDLPTLPEDTIFNTLLQNGTKGQAYVGDLSFRLPETTSPVAAYDSTTPANLPIDKFVITGIDSLPPGLKWTANASEYNPTVNKDGCIRLCGTPTDTGSFEMIVRLDVTVFIITRQANFRVKIQIDPAQVTNDGFTMTDFEGCGEVTVGFTNNHPSNGQDGFTYAWDFGDSTFFYEENPPAHTYSEPGNYIVQYQALVDTAGYTLADIEVLEVGCVDNLGLGNPDVYLLILDEVGAEIFNSSPYINNIELPYTFPIDLDLSMGNYTIEVWDEDSGLKGSDDLCGTVSFNILSSDTLTAGDLTLNMNVEHPIAEVLSQDTVRVHAQPSPPSINTSSDVEICEGDGEIFLFSSSTTGNTWWKNGNPISGATDFSYEALESGFYQVKITTSAGCFAISDSLEVNIYPLPNAMPYVNHNNHLFISDSLAVTSYSVQWLFNSDTLIGETNFDLCAMTDGVYSYILTDNQTSCSNSYSSFIAIDPNFDCTVPTKKILEESIAIFPNPAFDFLRIEVSNREEVKSVTLIDGLGRTIIGRIEIIGQNNYVLPVGGIPSSMYILRIELKNGVDLNRRIIVQH